MEPDISFTYHLKCCFHYFWWLFSIACLSSLLMCLAWEGNFKLHGCFSWNTVWSHFVGTPWQWYELRLAFSIWPFKWHVSAVARGLYKFIPNVEYVFSLLDKKRTFNGTILSHLCVKVKIIPTLSAYPYHFVSLWHVLMFVCMPSWITYSWSVMCVTDKTS